MSISQIDISKINENGKYIDFETMEMYTLTDKEILALREYYQDKTIASQRKINSHISATEEELPKKHYQPKHLETSSKPTYRVSRDQRYNRGHYHTKKNPHNFPGKLLIIGGLVICLVCGTKIYRIINNQNDLSTDLLSIEQTYNNNEDYEKIMPSNPNHLPKSSIKVNIDEAELEEDIKIENQTSAQDPSANQEETANQESTINQDEAVGRENVPDSSSNAADLEQISYEQERKNLIQNLCDIYQVDFNIIYNQIVKLTDNFTSSEYLNGTLEGVTCKGVAVQANSEEELFLYTVRCMKQLPARFNLSNDIYINNGYVSSTDYCAIIKRVANTLGLNKCLLYAIVKSECSFDSPMFNEINNPAGLRNEGQWWAFDTKEEGFFELGMELLKYYRKIDETPDQIDYDTIVKIRDIHAPLSDGNDLWLSNVLSNLEYAQLHEAELFSTNEPTNGFSIS